MAVKVVKHPIGDNALIIENQEYFGLDVDKIAVGVENKAQNRVELQEVYNLKTQRNRPWFVLALETGSRGWFPGCIIRGTIASGHIKASPSDEAEDLGELVNTEVTVLEIASIKDEPKNLGWHRITIGNINGYIKQNLVSNLHYADPLNL